MNQLDKPKGRPITKCSQECYDFIYSIVPDPKLMIDFKLSIDKDNLLVINCEYYATDENLKVISDLARTLKKEYTFVEKEVHEIQ